MYKLAEDIRVADVLQRAGIDRGEGFRTGRAAAAVEHGITFHGKKKDLQRYQKALFGEESILYMITTDKC